MFFLACARTVATVALSMSSVFAAKDSTCATIKVVGVVVDTAHKHRPGVWIQDGTRKPIGQRMKVDTNGAFHLTLDKKHQAIWVFADSTGETPMQSIGWYETSLLQVKKCIASPITIIVRR